MRITPLDPAARHALAATLHPALHPYPVGLLRYAPAETTEAWAAVRGRGPARAWLLGVGRRAGGVALAVPGGDPEGCRALGAVLRASPAALLHGGAGAVEALWQGAGEPPATWRAAQVQYRATQVAPGPRLTLREAAHADLDQACAWAALVEQGDLGAPPADPAAHRAEVAARVRQRRVWLGLDGDRVVFQLDLGARWPHAALVGGVVVDPEARGRGYGAAGMRAALDRLLAGSRAVALHVRVDNLAAARAYAAAGLQVGPEHLLIAAAAPAR